MKKIVLCYVGLCFTLQLSAQTFVTSGNSGNVNIWYNGTGNVGIGTNAPIHKLDVNASTTAFLTRINNTNNTGKALFIQQTTTSTGTQEIMRVSKLIGTTETPLFVIKANNKIGMGTTLSGSSLPTDFNEYRLFVRNGIRTEKVKVDVATTGWADFVFAPTYKLRTLKEVEQYITQKQHLPDVPSAQELEQNGMNLGEMHKIQMIKIEELTLYLISLQKEIDQLKQTIEELKKQ